MIGKFVATLLALAAVGMNLSYTQTSDTQISSTEVVEEEVTEVLQTEVSVLQFTDVDGNVLMDGSAEYIKEAELIFGYVSGPGSSPEHYVTVYFTPEGREKFKSITQSVVARTEMGENVINITVDGEILSSPMVVEAIDADRCIIAGDFTKESAKELVDAINKGIK